MIPVIHDRPPNFDEIAAVLPVVKTRKGILYTYGDSVYNPDGVDIPSWLAEHEGVHIAQQRAHGAPAWWTRYLADPPFRLSQELEAMVVEYRAYCASLPAPNRERRAEFIDILASRISGHVYGYMIRKKDAKRILKQRV